MQLQNYINDMKTKGHKGKFYIFYNKLEEKYYSYSEYIEKQNPQLYENIDLQFIETVEI